MCQQLNIKRRIAKTSALTCFQQVPKHTDIISPNKTNRFVSTLQTELSKSILMTLTTVPFFRDKPAWMSI